MPADLTIGAEFNQDLLHDMMTGYGRDMRQDTWTASVFAQNEWKNDKFGILIGGRLDKHNLIDAPVFSPRAPCATTPPATSTSAQAIPRDSGLLRHLTRTCILTMWAAPYP